MIRKQIYLTPQIDRELNIRARSEGKSVAEIIREILAGDLKLNLKKNEAPGAVLLRMAGQAGKGPEDLSSNITEYLYGNQSPNYGKDQ